MVKVGIIGASGYSGGELIRLLLRHPLAELMYLTADKYADLEVEEVFPNLQGQIDGIFKKYSRDEAKSNCEIFFVALPHGLSQKIVQELYNGENKIIDLGADFRLKESFLYQEWYGFEKEPNKLIEKAVYGLPELNREKIKKSKLVANPGCYPTSAILALAPLVKNKLIKEDSININAQSGVSGAGRKLEASNLFAQRTESVTCYKPGKHQHIPEIEQELSDLAGARIKISFVPHLVPMSRGIFSTVFSKLKDKIDEDDLKTEYLNFYKNEPFVEILPTGKYPETKNVTGTNNCQLQIAIDQRSNQVIVFSVIDNLVKGASGQAVQNMNVMLGCNELTAINTSPVFP